MSNPGQSLHDILSRFAGYVSRHGENRDGDKHSQRRTFEFAIALPHSIGQKCQPQTPCPRPVCDSSSDADVPDLSAQLIQLSHLGDVQKSGQQCEAQGHRTFAAHRIARKRRRCNTRFAMQWPPLGPHRRQSRWHRTNFCKVSATRFFRGDDRTEIRPLAASSVGDS